MRLHKTGHPIADTVSDLIGELPDEIFQIQNASVLDRGERCEIAYGILRHDRFKADRWFALDKGYWGASHYDGNYRIAYKGTQAKYASDGPHEPHGLTLEPWRSQDGPALICPPTSHVSDFFGIDPTSWLLKAIRQSEGNYIIRHKGNSAPVDWDKISKVITFNSTIGVEALAKGIEVISDPVHSTIGSYTVDIKCIEDVNRDELFSFMQAHQFKLHEKEKISWLINHYLTSSSAMTAEKRFAQTF